MNQELFSTTKGATSIKLLINKEMEPMRVIEKWSEYMEARYLQLKAGKQEMIHSDYLAKLYRYNQWANFKCNDQIFEGKIRGTSALGKLQVELRSAEIKEFDLKEIVFI